MINEWNFFIIFQYTTISAPYFDEVIKKDILNAGTSNLYFHIFKHIADEARAEIITYRYDATVANQEMLWLSRPVTADLSSFFADPSLAQEIWSNFFKEGNKREGRLNFITINGHGGGLSFSPNKISDFLRTQKEKEAFFVSSLIQNIETRFYQNLPEEKFKALSSVDTRALKVIPVSFFKEAIASAFTKKVEFLFLENCFMQCAETGFVFKDNVKFLGGAEGEYFLGNMPYDELSSGIISIGLTLTDRDLKTIANKIVINLDKRYDRIEIKNIFRRTAIKEAEMRNFFSYSINDLSAYNNLKSLISDFGDKILSAAKTDDHLYFDIHKLRSDRKICRDVIDGDFIGIIDFANFLSELEKLPSATLDFMRPSIRDLINFINEKVVFEKHFPPESFNRNKAKGICPHGVSLFFPRNLKVFPYSEKTTAVFNEIYSSDNPTFLFVHGNKWADFVKDYFNKTDFPRLPPVGFGTRFLEVVKKVTEFFFR